MVTRYTMFAPGEYYHVYNRGVEKRTIFHDANDYRRFQQLLYIANNVDYVNVRDLFLQYKTLYEVPKDEVLVSIGAYCLMPNHFHILLSPLVEGGVGTFMNKLGTSYSMYFNRRYERTGRLFEGSYKAKHASDDRYLKYLYAYIHLNPVRSKYPHNTSGETLLTEAAQYSYSSLLDYMMFNGDREASVIIDPSQFPEYFFKPRDHQKELLDWLTVEP
jgi:putative transposase